jgi:hypothetical protein
VLGLDVRTSRRHAAHPATPLGHHRDGRVAGRPEQIRFARDVALIAAQHDEGPPLQRLADGQGRGDARLKRQHDRARADVGPRLHPVGAAVPGAAAPAALGVAAAAGAGHGYNAGHRHGHLRQQPPGPPDARNEIAVNHVRPISLDPGRLDTGRIAHGGRARM